MALFFVKEVFSLLYFVSFLHDDTGTALVRPCFVSVYLVPVVRRVTSFVSALFFVFPLDVI